MTYQDTYRGRTRAARAYRTEPMGVGEMLLAVAGLLVALVLFGIAGSMDYEDRVSGLSNMMPTGEWARELD